MLLDQVSPISVTFNAALLLSRFLPEKKHLIRASNESIRRLSRLLVNVNAPKYYIEKITSDHLSALMQEPFY